MARPPSPLQLPFTERDALDRVRASGALKPFGAWDVAEASTRGFVPDAAELLLVLVAGPGAAVSGLAARLEVPCEVRVNARTGAPADAGSAARELSALRDRVLALAQKAAADPDVTAWIAKNSPVTARFDPVGAAGRLSLLAPREDGQGPPPILFPSPA